MYITAYFAGEISTEALQQATREDLDSVTDVSIAIRYGEPLSTVVVATNIPHINPSDLRDSIAKTVHFKQEGSIETPPTVHGLIKQAREQSDEVRTRIQDKQADSRAARPALLEPRKD